MSSHNGALPEWRPILRGRDVEETRAYLRAGFGKDLQFEPARGQGGRTDVRIEGIDLPSMLIHHARSATAAIKGNLSGDHVVITLPTSGCIETSAGGFSIVCDPHHAVIFPPGIPCLHAHRDAAAELNLRLSHTAVVRQLSALLGESVDALPQFVPIIDLSEGYGRSIASYLLLAVTDFRRADSAQWNPIMISGFEDFIISKLLLSHPHSYTTALRRADQPVAPRDVKRAIDYMQAKLGSPISIADIAEASGIAGRTLFKHFQDFHGISPMQYLRSARFAKVREALRRAEPEESVTEIAMSWGFSHMGRFSVQYRKRFGERPSETLRRSWRRA